MKKHFSLISQYAIGILFGWGLIISGMSNPQKILLDYGIPPYSLLWAVRS